MALLIDSIYVIELRLEFRSGEDNIGIRLQWPVARLQVPQVSQAVTVHGVQKKSSLGTDFQGAGGGNLAESVGCLASVGTAVLRVGIKNVQSNKTKVIGRAETMALRHGLAIAKPLNLVMEKQSAH